MREGEWLIGFGCAAAAYPANIGAAAARVSLDASGHALVQIAAHDIGNGTHTIVAQTAVERLGVPLDKITVQIGDTDLPPGGLAAGSSHASGICHALAQACDEIRERIAFAAVTAFGAQFVEVRVHSATRDTRVRRSVSAFAAGRIINPRTAHSQLVGGVNWGISSALHEATEIDRELARYTNDNISEYLIPVNADIGEVDIILVPEEDHEVNPLGMKGVGEIGAVGMNAAIANAVYHATGRRIRHLPIRLENLI